MRRERKENETAMQHYAEGYECASLSTFCPAMALLCRSAKCGGELLSARQRLMPAFLASELCNLSLSLEEGVLSIVSKPKARLDWRRFFLSFECELVLP